MRYVALMEQHSLREMSQFVALASTLLLIKSRSLLPVLAVTEAEEESITNLEERLRLYQIFRDAGRNLSTVYGVHMNTERPFVMNHTPLFMPDIRTTATGLLEALRDVIRNLPQKVERPKVQVKKVLSLEDMISRLHERIEQQLTLTFKDFAGREGERGTVIVGFLAVLEMVKQGHVLVRQAAHYTDIEIERDSSKLPSYR